MSINEKITNTLDLPKDVTLDFAKMIMLADNDLTVENFKGIIEYTESTIRLNTSTHLLKIEGDSLNIKYITREEVEIIGKIKKIVFE